MSVNKTTDIARLKNHYGLALEEIKLERTINNMSIMMAAIESRGPSDYLQGEIASQQRQLQSLKKLRGQ